MIIKMPRGNGRKRNYICDDCKDEIATFSNYDKARAEGWAISYTRLKCYCPKCAPYHRHVGCSGGVNTWIT